MIFDFFATGPTYCPETYFIQQRICPVLCQEPLQTERHRERERERAANNLLQGLSDHLTHHPLNHPLNHPLQSQKLLFIFDYHHPLVRDYPEWLYTCITRARDLSRVKFFRYKNDTDDEFNMNNIISYFERKIENYKTQDRKNKFVIPKEGYVNKQWIINNITNNCNYCGGGFGISMNNGNVKTNLTCQRKQNELPHTLV